MTPYPDSLASLAAWARPLDPESSLVLIMTKPEQGREAWSLGAEAAAGACGSRNSGIGHTPWETQR